MEISPAQESYSAQMRHGNTALRVHCLAKAEHFFQLAADTPELPSSSRAEAAQMLGVVQSMRGRHEDAIRSFGRALNALPAAAHLLRGNILRDIGLSQARVHRFADAICTFELAFDEFVSARATTADLEQIKRIEEAVAVTQGALGAAMFDRGKEPEGLALMHKANEALRHLDNRVWELNNLRRLLKRTDDPLEYDKLMGDGLALAWRLREWSSFADILSSVFRRSMQFHLRRP